MFPKHLCVFWGLLSMMGISAGGYAAPTTRRVLIVATTEAPPFAMKDSKGAWHGAAIELWQRTADRLGIQYQFRESSLDGMLDGVANHTFDAAIAAITITAQREKTLDFTQPYYISGLDIAVPNRREAGWLRVVRQFFSIEFLKVIVGLTALLLAAGLLVWLFERRRNAGQFGGPGGDGIASGFWWAAVTMTTVGYGDKAPLTWGGRVVGLIWMFTGVIVISSFTAAITTSLTVSRLQGPVQDIGDLGQARVGAMSTSTAADYLKAHHISFIGYPSAAQALQALNDGKLEAVVHDAPILRYEIKRHFQGRLKVLNDTFERQYYGIALPNGSPLREKLDRQILEEISSPHWLEALKTYGIE